MELIFVISKGYIILDEETLNVDNQEKTKFVFHACPFGTQSGENLFNMYNAAFIPLAPFLTMLK